MALADAVAAWRARVEEIRAVIGGHERQVQRRTGAQKPLDWLVAREERLARENGEAEARIADITAETQEIVLLVQDLERTLSISESAALAGKKGKVHIRVGRRP
jgi:hypothetical protein